MTSLDIFFIVLLIVLAFGLLFVTCLGFPFFWIDESEPKKVKHNRKELELWEQPQAVYLNRRGFFCPCCKGQIYHWTHDSRKHYVQTAFCPRCGQKLKWGDAWEKTKK